MTETFTPTLIWRPVRGGRVCLDGTPEIEAEEQRARAAISEASERRERAVLQGRIEGRSMTIERRDQLQNEIALADRDLRVLGAYVNRVESELTGRRLIAEIEAERERARARLGELDAAAVVPDEWHEVAGGAAKWGRP